jgi:O-antigen/teichoic acid export membrane protein
MGEMRNERALLARNAASSYAARGLLVVSALLLTPYLFRQLGVAGFGTWSVIFALATVFNLLEVGVSGGVVRHVAALRAGGGRDEVVRMYRAGVALLAVVGVLAAASAVLAASVLDGLAAAGERDDFRLGLLALGAAMLVRLPCAAAGAALNGLQRYDLTSLALGATTVGSAAGSVVAVELGYGVLGVAVAHAAALAAGGVLQLVLLAAVDRGLAFGVGGTGSSPLRGLARFSSYTLLADSMIFVGQRLDVVVIAAVRNAATAAPYAAAVKLQSGLQALTLPLIEMLMPMLSGLWASGRRDEARARLVLATRGTLQATLPLAAGLALFAQDLVDVWLGPSAPAVTATLIVLLMAVQVLTLAPYASEKALIAVGRVRAIGLLSLAEGLGNIALSIALTFAYGALGPALGTLLVNGLLAPVRFPLACRALGMPLGRFLRASIVPAVLSSLPALAAMIAVRLALDPGAARAFGGLALGVTLALAVALAQVRPAAARRVFGSRGRGIESVGTAPSDSPLQ